MFGNHKRTSSEMEVCGSHENSVVNNHSEIIASSKKPRQGVSSSVISPYPSFLQSSHQNNFPSSDTQNSSNNSNFYTTVSPRVSASPSSSSAYYRNSRKDSPSVKSSTTPHSDYNINTHSYNSSLVYSNPNTHSTMTSNNKSGQVFSLSSSSSSLPFCILLPSKCVGYIIGKSGAAARDIEAESGAHINFQKIQDQYASPHLQASDKLVAISGTLENKTRALGMIIRKVRMIAPVAPPVSSMVRSREIEGNENLTVLISVCAIPHLIGPKGSTINDLTSRSGCEYNIQKEPMFEYDDRAVFLRAKTIENLTSGVEMMYALFESLIAQNKMKDSDYLRPLEAIFRGSSESMGSYHGGGAHQQSLTILNPHSMPGSHYSYGSISGPSNHIPSTHIPSHGPSSHISSGHIPSGHISSVHMQPVRSGTKLSPHVLQQHTTAKYTSNNLLEHPIAQINTRSSIRFIITAETAAWIVGRGGSHIKDIKKVTGAEILVSDSKDQVDGLGDNERLLCFTGSIITKFNAMKAVIGKICEKSNINNVYQSVSNKSNTVVLNSSTTKTTSTNNSAMPDNNEKNDASDSTHLVSESSGGNNRQNEITTREGGDGSLKEGTTTSTVNGFSSDIVNSHSGSPSGSPPTTDVLSSSKGSSLLYQSSPTTLYLQGSKYSSFSGSTTEKLPTTSTSPSNVESSLPVVSSGGSTTELKMLVPTKSVSFLIGKKGIVIRQITSNSGASVRVDDGKSVSGERVLLISGAGDSKLIASILIWIKLEELENAEITEENLSIPVGDILDKNFGYREGNFNSMMNENNGSGGTMFLENSFFNRASRLMGSNRAGGGEIFNTGNSNGTISSNVMNTQQQYVLEVFFPKMNIDRLLKYDHLGRSPLLEIMELSGCSISVGGDAINSYAKSLFLSGTPLSNSLACLLIQEKFVEFDGYAGRDGGYTNWR